MDLKALELSDRAENALRRAGVKTVEQLLDMTVSDLMACRGIGSTLGWEIMDKLSIWNENRNGAP